MVCAFYMIQNPGNSELLHSTALERKSLSKSFCNFWK